MATVAALADAPEVLEAIIAASTTRSARLSAGMTQLLLEVQSNRPARDGAALHALFRPKR